MRLLIGIDPGTHTGYATKHADSKKLIEVRTLLLHEVLFMINEEKVSGAVFVLFEDARRRTWFANKGKEALQGAGSIKRDCSIIEDFCEDLNIPYFAQAPRSGMTKLDSETFATLTGWTARTSNHARDAAMLIYGINEPAALSLFKAWEQRK